VCERVSICVCVSLSLSLSFCPWSCAEHAGADHPCVCARVCVLCECLCMHVCVFAFMSVSVYLSVLGHALSNAGVHHLYACVRVWEWCVSVHLCVCICVCVCVCVCATNVSGKMYLVECL